MLSFGAESFVFLFAILNIKIYRNIILPIVLCGYETWSFTLREEYKLRVFENKEIIWVKERRDNRGVEKTTQ